MIQLTADESRVLGVLVEKAQTTPEQYPLTLNQVVNGANQKNNRDPVLAMDETAAFDALEGLRAKGLVVRVDSVGSRTNRYRHNASEVLRVRPAELALLAELLLRGPQTLGELRGRASRMHPFETLDDVKNMLRALAERDEPMVKDVPPAPGSRGGRYAQLVCPDLHPLEGVGASAEAPDTAVESRAATGPAAAGGLPDRVAHLEAEVIRLRAALTGLATALGEPDPLSETETQADGDVTA
jgi:uncharacterized protein YceH (UPF0502 family)